jgi:hypothetical protein
MHETRYAGLPEPKPDHEGTAGPPLGESVFVIVSHTGTMVGVEPTRHAAAWTIEKLHDANDYEVVMVPLGAVPLADLSIP